jgi:hypothetical protein
MTGEVTVADVPGDPDAVLAAAHALDGASGRLEGLAAAVRGPDGGLDDGWSGIAAIAARVACAGFAAPLRTGDTACRDAAQALRRYAHELRSAQDLSRRARIAAADAAAESARAQAAADSAALGPTPDPAAHAQAMSRVASAQDALLGAAAAGLNAYTLAEQAAADCAAALAQAALMAPEPPPPPPPPQADPEEGKNWFQRRLDDAKGAWNAVEGAWDTVGGMGSPYNPHSPAFAHDVIDGAAGAVEGAGSFVWTAFKAGNNNYRAIDQHGSDAARRDLATAADYAYHHPWETAGAIIGTDELTSGHPGRWFGDMGVNVLVTMASGGAGATAKVGSTTSRVVDRAAVAYRMRRALKVDDVAAKGRIDYSKGFEDDVENFLPKPDAPASGPLDQDRWIVTFGDSAVEAGTPGRSMKWWTDLDSARQMTSVEDLRRQLALPEHWTPDGPLQTKDEVLIAKVPAGTDTTRWEGIAGPQAGHPAPQPGGGFQIRYKETDAGWVVARMRSGDFFAGHLPKGIPTP